MPSEETLPALIKRGEYASRFQAILKDRADQFTSSILQIGASMPNVEPRSILAAGMMAATLDLPVNKSLGFAWIIPYRLKGGANLAQFQLGYRGYIQLALRSGAYKAFNARVLNAEVVTGTNEIGDPILDWTKLDETKPPAFYFVGWICTNGFQKVAAWPEVRVKAHAERYSESYRKGAAIWRDNFQEMALKTVIANELRKYGILSVQMQRALFSDQQAARDVGEEFQPVDAVSDAMAGGSEESRTKAAEIPEGRDEDENELAEAGLAPSKSPASGHAQRTLAQIVTEAGFSFDDFARLGRASKWEAKWDDIQSFDDLPEDLAKTCLAAKRMLLVQLQKQNKKATVAS